MALLAPQLSKITGTEVTFSAAAGGGDTIRPTERGTLLVNNGSGGSINVTVVVPGNTKYGQPQPDIVVAVGAGDIAAIGPFPLDLADPADGLIDITYSSATTVTVALVTTG